MLYLLLLISLIILLAVLMGFVMSKKRAFEELASKDFSLDDYKLKERIMSDSEMGFYINLKKSLEDKFIVLSKVRIEDFIKVAESGMPFGEKESLRNRIKSRHVDFLICDRETTKPLLAIELDGSSHKNSKRVERDKFVNELCESVNLPIEHVHVGDDFKEKSAALREILLSKKY